MIKGIASTVRGFAGVLALGWVVFVCWGCAREAPVETADRVVIDYWEKWGGFEAEAMRAIVDDFNASQDAIWVNFLSVSQIDRKLLLATAGGNPPDVAGFRSYDIPAYAENNALMPLDAFVAAAGITEADYLPVFWQLGRHRGYLWGLPSTPATNALHWNKHAFREAGLDPEQPPRSLAELEMFNEKLLLRDASGRIVRLGHNPLEPGWWRASWVHWFGGTEWAKGPGIEADSPQMQATFTWLESYPERFGAHELQQLRNSFGSFASPQNPFFTGRVAMVLQGPWMANFIRKFAPEGFEWGVAPFPSVDPERWPGVTLAESDMLVIPAGAKHPEAAFAFIAYVQQQGPMEKLCLAHQKLSPRREISERFYEEHANPDIRVFQELAASPNAGTTPPITLWSEYRNELNNAVDSVVLSGEGPAAVLPGLQASMAAAYARAQLRWEQVAAQREEGWREAVEE